MYKTTIDKKKTKKKPDTFRLATSTAHRFLASKFGPPTIAPKTDPTA